MASYVTQPVAKGTIVQSVSGSGQVSPENQLDLKSQVSEKLVYLAVNSGQQVRAGQLIAQFDTTDAQKAVRDAQLSLDSAKLTLQKLQDTGSTTIPISQQQARDNLTKAYTDAFNSVSNTFLDLPGIMTGLDDALHGTDFEQYTQNMDYYAGSSTLYTSTEDDKLQTYKQNASDAYDKAKTVYDKNFDDYKAMNRSADPASIAAMLTETYATTQEISDAVKDTYNLIQLYEDLYTKYGMTINPTADTQMSGLMTDTSKADTDLSNLLTAQATIKSDQDAITSANLDQQTQNFSVQSQNLSIQQSQNALTDAKAALANCYLYAPFAGTIASIPAKLHDTVSSGTVIATLITDQSITEIPFNEVDITKIKTGQKATLTFDAIPNLTLVGTVADIDTLGTVTQGVVNYNVKIAFDASGTKVKPGMSVTANVITATKQNVLTVPNSAVKQQGGSSYVQVLVNGNPVSMPVQTGLSSDTETEITSGLNEGDKVITQTITATAATNSSGGQPAGGGFRFGGGGTGGGGGGVFIRGGGG